MTSLGLVIDQVLRRIDELGLAGKPECYAVSEAVYLLAGGRESELRVMRVAGKPRGHWFLCGPRGELIDLTAGQFAGKYPDYGAAKRAAFFPNRSTLAKKLMA